MPITKLDTSPALVVIDLQKGIVGMPTVHPIGDILSWTARLPRAFRQRSLPVVLVNVAGGAPGRTDAGRPQLSRPADWTELAPEWSNSPATISSLKNDGAHLLVQLWMNICGSAVSPKSS